MLSSICRCFDVTPISDGALSFNGISLAKLTDIAGLFGEDVILSPNLFISNVPMFPGDPQTKRGDSIGNKSSCSSLTSRNQGCANRVLKLARSVGRTINIFPVRSAKSAENDSAFGSFAIEEAISLPNFSLLCKTYDHIDNDKKLV